MENNEEKLAIQVVREGGLICDQPNCDWEDMSIDPKDYPLWIDASCPKCGEAPILTQEDYDNHMILMKVIGMANEHFKKVGLPEGSEDTELLQMTAHSVNGEIKIVIKDSEGNIIK